MNAFIDYSKYYNLLYKDKAYQDEVNYIRQLVHQYNPTAQSILDVGCGTGNHAKLLSLSYDTVYGIDLSETMIAIAKENAPSKVKFDQGDARSFQIDRKFDAITSLFHVISYQITNEDLISAFTNIHQHLNIGGTFIFDYWYGPAVLTDPPKVRVKNFEDNSLKIMRLATPEFNFTESVVNVNFEVNVYDKESRNLQTVFETHRMRYFFLTELTFLLRSCGYEIIQTFAWLTQEMPTQNSWYATTICRKNK